MSPEPTDAWAREDLELVLDVLGQAHVTFWAAAGAEKDYAIRLWNPGAERIYGHTRDEALGTSYIDLFVNPRERARAIEDHERIMRTGEIYEWDWAADDLTKGKKVRTMLTHCFRVRDPEDGSWLLAELGIDISDFTRATQQLRLLREDDFARREMTLAYAVGEIGQAVSQVALDGSTAAVAQKVFEASRIAVSGVGRCTIWLFDGDVDRLDDREASAGPAFREDEAVDLVVETGEPVFFDTSGTESGGLELSVGARRSRRRSFALLPLRTFHSRQLGVLGVSLTSGKALSQRDRERLQSVAAFAGPLLSVSQELQKHREERTRRLVVQTKQTVFESVLHTLGNDVFQLGLLVDTMGDPSEREEVPEDVRSTLSTLRHRVESLNSSLAELRRDLASEDQPENVSVLEVSTHLVNRLGISHPNVRFAVDAAPEDIAHVVRVSLNHILENVVTNAVQVMEQWVGGGTVSIRAVAGSEGRIDIHVEDDGPGVDPAIAAILFERGITRRAGGTGDGLAIASELTARSGGEIRLLPGKSTLGGAHFCVSLPV